MPRITVITAAWLDNTEKVKWLGECAESVLSQEFDGLEWIVVDDHSPLSPYLPVEDPRVRLLRAAERQGPAKCRNTAASLAESDAIIALDADDMFAAPDVLDRMWQHWERRPDRFYFGNMQILNQGVPGKVHQFPLYNFVQTLDPKGVIPVTALHSKEAWYKAGGWKAGLEHGLEDVEYWISVGKAGFCGFKLDLLVFLYRKHGQSRSAAMRATGSSKQREMEIMIEGMHSDVYAGRLPMGCCGGRGGGGVTGQPLPIAQPRARALLSDDLPGGKVWVRYNGQRTGTFNMRGQVTGTPYEVDGKEAEFQIHAQDAAFFSKLGRGKDFTVGIAPPVAPEPDPVVQAQEEQGYSPPPPEPATVVRLDREPEPEPQIDLDQAELELAKQVIDESRKQRMAIKEIRIDEATETADAAEIFEAAKDNPLEEITCVGDDIKTMLEKEGWTVPQLARAIPEELMPYPRVGKVTAQRLIEEAQALWEA